MSEQNGSTRKQYFVNVPSSTLVCNFRLVSDPEMRYTGQGTAVASFRAVTARKFQKDGEWSEKATFVRVSVWREAAERLNNAGLHKGDVVQVTWDSADMDAQAYLPKDGGDPRGSLEITASSVKWIAKDANGEHEEAVSETAEEIPF